MAADLIPEAVARHHMVLPIRIDNGVPVVAMANPTDVFAMDDLRTIMGRNFTPVVATRSQIAIAPSLRPRRRHRRGRGRRGRCQRDRRRLGGSSSRTSGGGRGRTDRSVCEPADPPGPQRAGVGHPHRADAQAPPHPVPHRRRDARRHLGLVVDRRARGQPAQGAGRDGHHRAPDPPGGPGFAVGERPPDRPPPGHPAVHLRRDGGHAAARQVRQHPDAARTGFFPDTLERYARPTATPTG